MFGRHGQKEARRLDVPREMEGSQATGPASSSPMDRQNNLTNSLTQLLETARRELDRDCELAKVSVARALSILRSETERRSGANGSRSGGLAGWQIARVRAFIDENLHTTIQTRHLSTIARLSTWHFSRSFKQAFGESPHAYVMRRRLERVCHLMMTSSASLTEIALAAGFSDPSHLASRFRRGVGQSPSSWRRERKIPGAVQSHGLATSDIQQAVRAGNS
jgi:AraC family transcriptional regulator